VKAFLVKIKHLLSNLYQFLTIDIWKLDFSQLSNVRAFLYQQILFVFSVAKAFVEDRLLVRASALVYATLLSLVPLLAIIFSLLKVFGFHNKIEPTLYQLLNPLGKESAELVITTILQFVDNASVGALGGVGLVVLFASVLSIINNIERAFNDIWRVQRGRSLKRRFLDYSSVIFLGPVLLFTVLGFTASMQSNSFVQIINNLPGVSMILTKSTPLVASWLAFYFLILFVPNTRVQFGSAAVGAILGGTIWQIGNSVFAQFIVTSYQSGAKAALYAGFATLPLFLIWLFLSWAVVLLAAEIAYAQQNLTKITWEVRKSHYSFALKEELAIRILVFIGTKFHYGKQAPNSAEIADQFHIPERLANNILTELVETGFLNRLEGDTAQYSIARSLENLSVADIFISLRQKGVNQLGNADKNTINENIQQIFSSYNTKINDSFDKIKLRDLIE
jgi:membrane protein